MTRLPPAPTARPCHGTTRKADSLIANALESFTRDGTLAGAVTLVASRDDTLGIATAGFADVQKHSPMEQDTVFWTAG